MRGAAAWSAHQAEEDRVDDLFEDVLGYGGEGPEDFVAQQVEGEGLGAFGEEFRFDLATVDGAAENASRWPRPRTPGRDAATLPRHG
ncbi:hypothetical protein SL103_24515 [Streptomyces lydicus]|uniref:Uncharacterized protein n=1 Tax=Streptomyces lydicus TaxID=47763 RepID=A0A1D7VR63_9ACTN|nr:hypothetical protein SL103_24515 [Streptomyces lydicus]